jgi:hypothetical protein
MVFTLRLIGYAAVAAVGTALFAVDPPGQGRNGAAAVALAAAPAPSTVSRDGVTLRSVAVELPASDRDFPGGAAAETITSDCTGCHSAGMVLAQPPLPAAAWRRIVDKMRESYKAPVPAEDVPKIVAYLTRLSSEK